MRFAKNTKNRSRIRNGNYANMAEAVYEHYRNCNLGKALDQVLYSLVDDQTLTESQAYGVLAAFDKVGSICRVALSPGCDSCGRIHFPHMYPLSVGELVYQCALKRGDTRLRFQLQGQFLSDSSPPNHVLLAVGNVEHIRKLR